MHNRYVQSLLSSLESQLNRLRRGDSGGPSFDEDRLEKRIIRLIKEVIMPTLDETLAKVTEQGDRLDSLIEFVSGLKKQLEEALAGQLTPEMQAKIDAIFKEAEENTGKIDAALNANTPPPEPQP